MNFIGGRNIASGPIKNSELYISGTNVFKSKDDISVAMAHNSIAFNGTHLLMLGNHVPAKDTYIMDTRNTEVWSKGPELLFPRAASQLGFVQVDGKLQFLVAGGFPNEKTVEILDPIENKWIIGTDLPYHIRDASVIQLDDTFVIIGGFNGRHINTLHVYDVKEKKFVAMDQTLKNAKKFTTSFLVPDHFCQQPEE